MLRSEQSRNDSIKYDKFVGLTVGARISGSYLETLERINNPAKYGATLGNNLVSELFTWSNQIGLFLGQRSLHKFQLQNSCNSSAL